MLELSRREFGFRPYFQNLFRMPFGVRRGRQHPLITVHQLIFTIRYCFERRRSCAL